MIFTPMVLGMIWELHDLLQNGNNGINFCTRIRRVLFHLPLVQLKQYFEFLQELSSVACKKEALMRYKAEIDHCIKLYPEIEENKTWDNYQLEHVLSGFLAESDMKKVQNLLMMNHKHINGSFTGPASSELLELVAKELHDVEVELAEIIKELQFCSDVSWV